MSTSDSFQLGKFTFRSVSSNVEVMFQDEMKSTEEIAEENHTQEEIDNAYQKGREEVQNEMQPVIDQLQMQLNELQQSQDQQLSALTQSLETYSEKLEKQLFDEVCSMSFKLAELILQREISQVEEVESLVRQALLEIHSEKKITVRLSLDDFNVLHEKFTSARMECINDPALLNGEAIIEYEQGHLDLTLKSRMQVLKDSFENIRSGENNA